METVNIKNIPLFFIFDENIEFMIIRLFNNLDLIELVMKTNKEIHRKKE